MKQEDFAFIRQIVEKIQRIEELEQRVAELELENINLKNNQQQKTSNSSSNAQSTKKPNNSPNNQFGGLTEDQYDMWTNNEEKRHRMR